MSEWIMFALGCAEMGVCLFAAAGAFLVFTYALQNLWFVKSDKIQFYAWLANTNKKLDNNL